MLKKKWSLIGFFALIFALGLTLAFPQSDDLEEIDGRTQRAIDRGLSYLARHQNKNGSWSDVVGKKANNFYIGQYGVHVGVTALAGMSFLAGGHLPGRGKYGENLKRTIDFFSNHFASKEKNPDGFIALNESRMYSHAFATLFLAEVYGMTHRPEIKKVLKRSIRLIERSQNKEGGWRYLPTAKDSDISISVCQLMALRAARNSGILVDPKVIKTAIKYVIESYIPYRTRSYRRYVQNGFWYQVHNQPSRTSYALTAAGVASLFAASEGRGLVDTYQRERIEEAIRGGLQYMMDPYNQPPASNMRDSFDYFYSQYYAAQAMYQAGQRFGRNYWTHWYRKVRDEIVGGQNIHDGKWEDLVGPNYATAMATLILQIPYRYLPIFQR